MSRSDTLPAGLLCAQDYEILALQTLASPAREYIAGGAGFEHTLRANREAFAAYRFAPHLLNDVSHGHTRCQLLTHEQPHPMLLAPLAYQQLAHPNAELDTARAARATDTAMICSTLSSMTLEDIAAHAGKHNWFQLYFQPQRDVTADLLQRAENAGYAALVVTLDAAIQAPGFRALRAGFSASRSCHAANLAGYPAATARPLGNGESRILQGMMGEAPTWQDLQWLMQKTRLPVIVKGVLRADDALRLRDLGVAALIVSNHGGRSLDGVPPSLEVLPQIRAAVGDHYPLLLDSGIRSGGDIFKALALGANAVLIGRLQVYALAVAGALGVAHLLRMLHEELELTMALCGCSTLADINLGHLLRQPVNGKAAELLENV